MRTGTSLFPRVRLSDKYVYRYW